MSAQNSGSRLASARIQAPDSGDLLVGAELGPQVIRARVFTAEGKLLGKAKLSTKLERGPKAVLARIERCIGYAIDECNLTPNRVRAVGLGLPGQVSDGVLRLSSALGWRDLPVQRVLERRLSVPVAVANLYNLAGWAIAAREFPDAPRPMVVVFPGAEIGGAVLREEGWVSLEAVAECRSTLRAPAENILCALPPSEFSAFRARDLRKAIRAGSLAAKEFVLQASDVATQRAAVLGRQFGARTLVLAGGAIEEISGEVLQRAQAKLGELRGPDGCHVLVSRLGDGAGLAGAAGVAAGQTVK